MSETATKQAPVVKRNNVEVTLVEQVFGKTSDQAGNKFWAPVIDVSSERDQTWVGIDHINGLVNKQLRLIFADIYIDAKKDNTDEATGVLNVAAFEAQMAADWADFTAGAAKLSDLEDQIGILQDQISEIIQGDEFGTLDDQGNKTAACTAAEEKVFALNQRISPLRKQYKSISEVYKERAAKRKAKAAASKTQTPAPAAVG